MKEGRQHFTGKAFSLPDWILKRDREGLPPNNLLNYGYAILRAIVARSLVASGLLPTLGIHHHNKYNAYCLADDIMEPFRPFVDSVVLEIVRNGEDFTELSTSIKKQLLVIPAIDVFIDDQRSSLMEGLQAEQRHHLQNALKEKAENLFTLSLSDSWLTD